MNVHVEIVLFAYSTSILEIKYNYDDGMCCRGFWKGNLVGAHLGVVCVQ